MARSVNTACSSTCYCSTYYCLLVLDTFWEKANFVTLAHSGDIVACSSLAYWVMSALLSSYSSYQLPMRFHRGSEQAGTHVTSLRNVYLPGYALPYL